MKWTLTIGGIVWLAVLAGGTGTAQTLKEFVQQKKTQINYLTQQIAALQVQLEQLKKGYKLVRSGLSTIQQITHGSLAAHKAFFAALKTINADIGRYAGSLEILSLAAEIEHRCRDALSHAKVCRQFTDSEITGFTEAASRLRAEATANLDALKQVITPNTLTMNDAARISRIEAISETAYQQLAAIKQMERQLQVLARQRLHGQSETDQLNVLHDIK